MATTKNITMKQFNGTDYDTLYPETIASQVQGIFTNSQTLTSATAALYGLGSNATPNDVFAWIGKYNQHWWRVRGQWTVWTTESVGVTDALVLSAVPSSSETYDIQIADSITQDPNTGELSLVSPETYSILYGTLARDLAPIAVAIKGKYIKGCYGNENNIYLISQIDTSNLHPIRSSNDYPDPEYRTMLAASSGNPFATLIIPTSYIESSAVWQYVNAADENAYPHSGVVDGAEYVYLGVPFENAVTAPNCEIVSYVGTGTYGASNPCSITFSFAPKVVMLVRGYLSTTNYENGVWLGDNTDSNYLVHYVPFLPTSFTAYAGFGHYTSSSKVYGKRSEDGKTLYWYNTGTNYNQLNQAGATYYFMGIG